MTRHDDLHWDFDYAEVHVAQCQIRGLEADVWRYRERCVTYKAAFLELRQILDMTDERLPRLETELRTTNTELQQRLSRASEEATFLRSNRDPMSQEHCVATQGVESLKAENSQSTGTLRSVRVEMG